MHGADFLYTDVWLSMGEPEDEWDARINELLPYQVNAALMEATGNPDVKFMHCLPALHNTETEVGRQIFEQRGIDGPGGDRRSLRVEGLDRLRPSREPAAHHQSVDGRHPDGVTPPGLPVGACRLTSAENDSVKGAAR